jgi:hypothetical protein
VVENNSEYAKECFMGLWKYIPQDQPSLRAQVRENIKVRSVTGVARHRPADYRYHCPCAGLCFLPPASVPLPTGQCEPHTQRNSHPTRRNIPPGMVLPPGMVPRHVRTL